MEIFSVRKEITFDASHRLVLGYQGKCAHVHGHTWKVRFEIKAIKLDSFGFVRDYGDFKIMKNWIDENLDHATLVSMHDETLLDFLMKEKQRNFVFAENPTSEYVAKMLYEIAHSLGLPVSAVEVDETCTSTARYET